MRTELVALIALSATALCVPACTEDPDSDVDNICTTGDNPAFPGQPLNPTAEQQADPRYGALREDSVPSASTDDEIASSDMGLVEMNPMGVPTRYCQLVGASQAAGRPIGSSVTTWPATTITYENGFGWTAIKKIFGQQRYGIVCTISEGNCIADAVHSQDASSCEAPLPGFSCAADATHHGATDNGENSSRAKAAAEAKSTHERLGSAKAKVSVKDAGTIGFAFEWDLGGAVNQRGGSMSDACRWVQAPAQPGPQPTATPGPTPTATPGPFPPV